MQKCRGLAFLPVSFVVAVPMMFSLPVVVFAGSKSSQAEAAKRADGDEDRHDPNNITGISRWMELCVEGNGKYKTRDFASAMSSYRSAVQLAPKNPYPYYLLGEAQLASGELSEAETSFKKAFEVESKRDSPLHAKLLFVMADLKERQKKWEEAKLAWQKYNEWVLAESDGGTFPLSALARIKAIDEALKLDKATQIVRDRIAAETDGGPGALSSPADAGLVGTKKN